MPESNPIKILSGILPCRCIDPLKRSMSPENFVRPSTPYCLVGWYFVANAPKQVFRRPPRQPGVSNGRASVAAAREAIRELTVIRLRHTELKCGVGSDKPCRGRLSFV